MDAATSANAVNAETDPEPRRPAEPDPAECCGSGCARCIFDVHDEAMQRYRDAHSAWEMRHADSGDK